MRVHILYINNFITHFNWYFNNFSGWNVAWLKESLETRAK